MDVLVNTDAATMSPVALFLAADWVVKAVMLGLLAASIWTWAIIIGFLVRARKVRRDIDRFETDFEQAEDIDAFHRLQGSRDTAIARVFSSGVREWRRSTASKQIDRDGTRERLATAMASSVADESETLADRLNVLATVGSVAPFVGLFGTVWGIIDAFHGIAMAGSASLRAVAPGISEALVATAMGLAAAIPAAIFYNYFGHVVREMAARMEDFALEFMNVSERSFEG